MTSLAIEDLGKVFVDLFHELAHLETPEHDHRFIDRLQWLAGQTSRVLAEGGPLLASRLRTGDPDG